MSPLESFKPWVVNRFFEKQKSRSRNQGDPGASNTTPPRNSNPKPRPFQALSELDESEVRWFWPGRIPFGTLTFLEGPPGVGKSTTMIDLAARASTRHSMPDGSRGDFDKPFGTLIATTEDMAGSTIRHRAQSAGADVSRIHVLSDLDSAYGSLFAEGRLTLPKDVPLLRREIIDLNIKLVIFDPVIEFFGTDVNYYHASDVRKALDPLKAMAAELDCAVVLLRHLNKTSSQTVLQRGQGSMALSGIARSILLALPNPSFDDSSHFVLTHSKCNLAKRAPSIAYALNEDEELKCSRVEWGDLVTFSADDLISRSPDREENSSRRDIEALLLERTETTPISIKAAQELVHECLGRHSPRTIRRAALDAGLITLNSHNVPPHRYWGRPGQSLPGPDTAAEAAPTVQTGKTENERAIAAFEPSPDSTNGLSGLDAASRDETHRIGESS